jgi:hypothetical protein
VKYAHSLDGGGIPPCAYVGYDALLFDRCRCVRVSGSEDERLCGRRHDTVSVTRCASRRVKQSCDTESS